MTILATHFLRYEWDYKIVKQSVVSGRFRKHVHNASALRFLKMLEAGADPNTVSTGGGSGFAVGMTPLLAASSWGKVDEVRLLIAAGADLHVRTPNMQQTAMHLVAGGNIESWGVDKTMGLLRLLVQKAVMCSEG